MSDGFWRLWTRATKTDTGEVSTPALLLEEGTESDVVFAILDETAWAHGADRARSLPEPTGPGPERDAAGPHAYIQSLEVAGPGLKRRPWWWVDALVQQVAHNTPPDPDARTNDESPRAKDYDPDPILVETEVLLSLLAAMRSRPFVLLAGISGSGKTQLARRIGKAWAAGLLPGDPSIERCVEDPTGQLKHPVVERVDGKWCKVLDLDPEQADWASRYGFTAVQSDWTDASHLWGYHVPLPDEARGFYGTTALRVFRSAWQQWQRCANPRKPTDSEPHFLLLDEMNLSRPEHYGSDLLSAMEVKGKDAVIELHRAGADQPLRGEDGHGQTVPARIGWAPNLVVVGTVNVDETTHSFAPKVLDRAALLEFTEVDLDFVMERILTADEKQVWAATLKRAEPTAAPPATVQTWFQNVNAILRPYNLHLGYRAAREILKTLVERGVTKTPGDVDALLSRQLRDKVLPRIRGPRAAVAPLLIELYAFAGGTNVSDDTDERELLDLVKAEEACGREEGASKEPARTRRKILEMLRRAHAVGFTSYFG
jgi:hypothetical protein